MSDATQSETVATNLVDRHYESVMTNGDVLRIPDRSNPAVRIKTEDSVATWANITETQQSITINRQAYCAFLVEDIAELQSSWNVRQSYTESAGYSLTAFIEGDLTSGLASLPSGFSQAVGVLGVDPADDDFLRAVQYLDDGDVPRTDRFILASPAMHIAFLKMDKFQREDYVGADKSRSAVLEARVGRAYGAPVYVSSLVNNNPAAANQSIGWFCHKRGVALIQQRRPTPHIDYVILSVGTGVLVDTIYQFAERLIAPSTLGGGTSDDRFNCGINSS